MVMQATRTVDVDEKVPGVPASALFWPWFAGQLTVVPFLVGWYLPQAGLSLKWSLWVAVGAAVVSFGLLGVAAGWRWVQHVARPIDVAGIPEDAVRWPRLAAPVVVWVLTLVVLGLFAVQVLHVGWVLVLGAVALLATTVSGLPWHWMVVFGRAVPALVKTLLVLAELLVLGWVAWQALWHVFDWLGWTGQDSRWTAAAAVCLGIGIPLFRSFRSGAGLPSATTHVVVGLFLGALLWGSVAAALGWGGLGGADLAGAPSDRSLPGRAGLVLCGVLMAQWLFWAADCSRHVAPDVPGSSVPRSLVAMPVAMYVALGGVLPAVALMVGGIVLASREGVSDLPTSWSEVWTRTASFGYLDSPRWGWAVMLPLALAVLSSTYVRAAADGAVLRTGWARYRAAARQAVQRGQEASKT